MSTAHKSPTSTTAARPPTKTDTDDANDDASRNARGIPSGNDKEGAGDSSSEREIDDVRAAPAADDHRPAEGEGKTDADIQNERHCDPPVWRDRVDDWGDASDGAADVSVGSEDACPTSPPKKARSEHGLGLGGNAAADADDAMVHTDKGVFEDRVPPGGIDSDSGGAVGHASTRLCPAQRDPTGDDGSQGRKTPPGAPAFLESRTGSDAGDSRDPRRNTGNETGSGKHTSLDNN